MTTIRKVGDSTDDPRTQEIFAELRATLGFVPNLYRGLANSPDVLSALWEARKELMRPNALDEMTKQWLAFASLALVNNQFSLHAHTARLRRRGVTDEQIAEAVGVLTYFAGMGSATNG